MIRLKWSVEQESMDSIYIVYFVTDRFNSMNIYHEVLHQILHQRYSTTSPISPPLLSSTWFGTRGFPNYLFINMCLAQGASSSTSSMLTFNFVFGVYGTNVDETLA
jgi:hypothetical protein